MRNAVRVTVLTLALAVVSLACVRVQSGFTLGPENDGATKTVSVGSELRLALPADYDWNIASTNTSALTLKSTLLGSVGGSNVKMWLFDVQSAGEFVIRATGEPPCRKSLPPCLAPTLSYHFSIRAQ
jgi:hypothetical protein